MPNHFHILVYFDLHHLHFRKSINMQNLERKIGTLQSSYTRAVNNQQKRTGSLFQAKFKMTEISEQVGAVHCFNYIHNNPVKAGLTKTSDGWQFSSFREYIGKEKVFCDHALAAKLLGISKNAGLFIEQSKRITNDPAVAERLFEGE
jgi:putative transposase